MHTFVIGVKPQGAQFADGPESAKKTAQILRGKQPPQKVEIDMGIFDIKIEPSGSRKIRLEFKPDPEQKTTGDFAIGERIKQKPMKLR